MKRKILYLVALILLFSTLLSSCGVYNPPIDDPDGNHSNDNPGNENPPVENPEGNNTEEEKPFTVSLNVNGKAYTPNEANGPYFVQWSDGFSVHTAELIDGVATMTGLDGDYTVTLLNMPSGYVYNPNGYTATNDIRDISIELIKPIRTTGSGTDLYNGIIELSKTGVYQAEIKRDMPDSTLQSNSIFYQFRPSKSGTYIIESWVDITDNSINPKMDIWNGTFANKYYSGITLDDGGYSSTYTKNFRRVIEVDEKEIGSVFAFGLRATSKDGEYPFNLTFSISLDGEFGRDWLKSELIIPKELEYKTPNYSSLDYTFTGLEINENGHNVFHGEMLKLWKKGEGVPMVSLGGNTGDNLSDKLNGSYQITFINPKSQRKIITTVAFTPADSAHGIVKITEEDKKAGTKISGNYSYAVCSDHAFSSLSDKDCNICGCKRAENGVTTPPSITLTFSGGTRISTAGFTVTYDGELTYGVGDGYYHFYDKENQSYGEIIYAKISQACRFLDLPFTEIEYVGNKNLTVNGGKENYKYFIEGGNIFNMGYFCVNNAENQVYCPCLETCGGACLIGCPHCHQQCNNVTQDVLDRKGGYADYVNQDGVHGVTEELRDFLQKYSTSQLLFFDGNGFVETNEEISIYAVEEDQWLFACGYYERN